MARALPMPDEQPVITTTGRLSGLVIVAMISIAEEEGKTKERTSGEDV
jgi:hypothetical protein